MMLSDLQCHLLTATLFKCGFLFDCAAIKKILTDTEHCMVPCTALDHCH